MTKLFEYSNKVHQRIFFIQFQKNTYAVIVEISMSDFPKENGY